MALKRTATIGKRVAPCQLACPLHSEIAGWLQLVKRREFRAAWELLLKNNPFPAIQGRVCYHTCEEQCNHLAVDSAIKIQQIERFVGDLALREHWELPAATAIREAEHFQVLIIGAGPAGLTAAYYLARCGFKVKILEASHHAGGMLWQSIPAYRLPRNILTAEINRVLQLPRVTIEYQHPVTDFLAEKARGDYAALLLATGAPCGKRLANLTSTEHTKVVTALACLKAIAEGETPALGRRLIVYGGGNTAIDLARSAVRLGVPEVTIVYRRGLAQMPAHQDEVRAARREGVQFHFGLTIEHLAVHDAQLTARVNQINERGEIIPTEQRIVLPVDTLALALNQQPDLKLFKDFTFNEQNILTVDEHFMTEFTGVFASGDLISNIRNVATAIAAGKKAAQQIKAYLIGDTAENDIAIANTSVVPRTAFGTSTSNTLPPLPNFTEQMENSTRPTDFREVSTTLPATEVCAEAERCFSCGNCQGCQKCVKTCPVGAVEYSECKQQITAIDAQRCRGCGRCIRVCPGKVLIWKQ